MMSTNTAKELFRKIHPAQVRYIKLGEGGKWEEECIERGIVRYGFGSANAERFPLCHVGKWDELTKSFLADGKWLIRKVS